MQSQSCCMHPAFSEHAWCGHGACSPGRRAVTPAANRGAPPAHCMRRPVTGHAPRVASAALSGVLHAPRQHAAYVPTRAACGRLASCLAGARPARANRRAVPASCMYRAGPGHAPRVYLPANALFRDVRGVKSAPRRPRLHRAHLLHALAVVTHFFWSARLAVNGGGVASVSLQAGPRRVSCSVRAAGVSSRLLSLLLDRIPPWNSDRTLGAHATLPADSCGAAAAPCIRPGRTTRAHAPGPTSCPPAWSPRLLPWAASRRRLRRPPPCVPRAQRSPCAASGARRPRRCVLRLSPTASVVRAFPCRRAR